MQTLNHVELASVVGGVTPKDLGHIPGTTIYRVPPREAVCNREQFDWMAERVGRGVEPHVVRADAALCGYPMPGSDPTPTKAQEYLNMPGTDLDFFKFLR
jgi:hypothetical protein